MLKHFIHQQNWQGVMQKHKKDTLPLPGFYNTSHAADYDYRPDLQSLWQEACDWRARHHISPASKDRYRIHLLGIDLQKDFCFPEGTLFVAGREGNGAVEDNQRIAEFVYRNLDTITDFTVTLDTHLAFQIFFAPFWIDAQGKPLAPHTEIETEMIHSGSLQPNPEVAHWLCGGNQKWLHGQVIHYCQQLEAAGKYKLYLWPPHVLLGSAGHALAGVIHECHLFHSYVRDVQSWMVSKGDHVLTENYSVLRPEVLTFHDQSAPFCANAELTDRLLSADALLVVGQAASHCVKSTLEDLAAEVAKRGAKPTAEIYILQDCMSSVSVPDGKGGFVVDFTPQTEAAFESFQKNGLHLVPSTTPMAQWPGSISQAGLKHM